MPVRSGWLSSDSQTREDTRLVSLGALTPTSTLATRSGILPGSPDGQYRISGFTLTGATGTMTATVSPGRAVVQGSDAQGAYPVALTEYLPLVFAAGDAQYGRVDLVVLRVYDDTYDGSGRAEAAVEIVQGTPAATPAVPATPALSVPLYQVTVPKGASAGANAIDWTAGITGMRTATVGLGGILPVTSDTSNGAYPGQYRDAGGVLQRWSGTAWADYQPPLVVETTTTGATATGSWTLSSFAARRTRGVCSFTLSFSRTTSSLTATAAGTTNPGNVTDELMGTLPAGWRPAVDSYAVVTDGYASGAARITTDGSVYLITWATSGVIQVGNNVRVSTCFVL
ncbi:hypothetical protein [Streptomyces hyaluromycini]|uniref:hypothetical protein n=1 Tax=Streptomyces hyaluromycini TaxID=1377993 RepID=UPI000B5CE2EE|nr:hypothetical protein [Streptomyces hyaluromycini]